MTRILVFALFLAPTVQYRVELGAFSFSLLEPVILLTSLVLLARHALIYRRLSIRSDPLLILLSLIALWAFVILPISADRQQSLSDLRNWLIPLAMCVALLTSIRRGWRSWLIVFVLLAVISSALGIFQHFADAYRPFATPSAALKTGFTLSQEQSSLEIASPAVGLFAHPNDFAMYLFLALMIAIGWRTPPRLRLVRYLSLGLILVALVWTFAKASLLLMPFSLTLYVLLRRVRSWSQIMVMYACLLLSGGAAAAILFRLLPAAFTRTFLWRVNLWSTAFDVLADHPEFLLVGNGMDAFSVRAIYAQPHNLYLYLILAYGLTGLTLSLAVIWYLLRLGYAAHKRRFFHDEPMLAALWAGLLGYFLIGLVESNLLGIEARTMLLMAVAGFVGLWRELRADKSLGQTHDGVTSNDRFPVSGTVPI